MKVNGQKICEPDCPERDPYCHGTCEIYLEFCRQQAERREKNRKEQKKIYTLKKTRL